MKTQTKPLQCFISAPGGTNLSQLLQVLREHDIRVLDPDKFAPGAVKFTEKIIASIEQSDLVIAVLGTATSSANVLFELGCAFALGKQTLVIAPQDYEIPSDIRDSLYIRATPDNQEAINFAIEQILSASYQEETRKSRLTDKSKPLGQLADDLLHRLTDSGEVFLEEDLANIVGNMLEASGCRPYRMESSHSNIRPDLVVWMDELEPYFGNPILIEVKRQINSPDQAKYVAEQTIRYTSLSGIPTVIIFADQISPAAIDMIARYPNLYFFDLRKFLARLREESFGQVIRKERNSRFHGRP
jgi:nucleoside 2-deoxyribosyltransferase